MKLNFLMRFNFDIVLLFALFGAGFYKRAKSFSYLALSADNLTHIAFVENDGNFYGIVLFLNAIFYLFRVLGKLTDYVFNQF